MKRFLIPLLTIFAFLFVTGAVFAQNDDNTVYGQKGKDLIVVEEDQVVDRDFYGGAGRVEIYGVVNGDVLTAGGQVVIDGTINGDVLAMGGTVDVNGVVSQDVRIIGGQLTINGEVGKNVSFIGGNIKLTDSARVGGSVLGAGGNATIAAPVGKDVTVAAGNLVLSSQIGDNVEATVESLRLTSEAEILGDLTYWSDNEASIAEGSRVSGQTNRYQPRQVDVGAGIAGEGIKGMLEAVKAFFSLTSLIASLVIGLLLIWLFPKFSQQAAEMIGDKPLSVFAVGLMGVLIAPIVVVFLIITLVGIPLALILASFYVVSIYLSKIFVALFVGALVLSWLKIKAKTGWIFIVGLALYFLTRNIMLIGWLVTLFSLFFGLGAFWLTLRNFFLAASKKQ